MYDVSAWIFIGADVDDGWGGTGAEVPAFDCYTIATVAEAVVGFCEGRFF